MAENKIECPKCHHEFSVTEALSADIEDRIKSKFQKAALKKEAELKQFAASLMQEKEAIAKKQDNLDKLIDEKLQSQKVALEKKLREEVQNKSKVELADLRAQNLEKSKQIEESQKLELDLRKKSRALEEKEKTIELELQRKFDEEKTKIEENIAKKIAEDQRLKTAEKDKQLDDMRRQIEDLKRKAEQGSQQSQGEILEIEIEDALTHLFPADQIEPVAKGKKGGDIVQKVITPSGQHAGTIVWETKRTQAWSDKWIDKLKGDQRDISAEFGVIVTQAMPKDVSHLAQIEGVWVVDYTTFQGLALALRSNLLQLFQARAAVVGKGEKLDYVYNYLTGTQFKQRIETIVEAFLSMQADLNSEKRTYTKLWAARELNLTRVVDSTVGMYGDIQGIIGASLPKISALELEGPSDEEK